MVPPGQLDDQTRMAYGHIARRGVTVTAYGPDLPPRPAPGVHGVAVPADDPLAGEQAVIVIGNYFAAGFIARADEPVSPDEPRYEAVLTYDRILITQAVRTLIDRIPPLPYDFAGTPA
ncbi:hypothetical protein ACFQO7_24350 [Catellatospora aurea]|uniref:Uncharacterized protein n=1 Tax=Catellatospora aurea TaxID=1337874 RepID=A0ABW2H3P2_9ACTN